MIQTDSKGKAIDVPTNTVVCPIIRNDMVIPMLKSLKEHTPANFKTIVINQCQPNRQFEEELYDNADYVLRTHYNLGFAQAANLGMRLAPSEYITVANDDIVFLPGPNGKSWWDGVLETFERFPTAAAVCPQSVKEPGWGWGEPGHRYLVPQTYLTGNLGKLFWEDRERMKKAKDTKAMWEDRFSENLSQKQEEALRGQLDQVYSDFEESQAELDSIVFELAHDPGFIAALVEEKNWMVVDGFACFLPVFRANTLAEVGMFDERFNAGGEDYDLLSRYYKAGYRMLSSSRSFVWHWWSKSKDSPDGYDVALPRARNPWNKLSVKGFGDDGLYSPDCSVWGEAWSIRVDPEVYRAPL